MIVMKFGGSSLESTSAILRVADIVRSRLPKHPVVVVSAMGKTTNALLAMAANASQGKRPEALAQLRAIEDFHRSEAAPLVSESHRKELETVLTDHFRDLGEIVEGLCAVSDLTPRSQDAVASFGERLSSRIVALALDSPVEALTTTSVTYATCSPASGRCSVRVTDRVCDLPSESVYVSVSV